MPPFFQLANSRRLVTARGRRDRLFDCGSVSGRRLGHRFLRRRRGRLARLRGTGAQERHGKKCKDRRKNNKFFHSQVDRSKKDS